MLLARRGRVKLAVEIPLASSAQIAGFLIPLVALISWAFEPLALSFRPIELVAMGAAAAVLPAIVLAGRENDPPRRNDSSARYSGLLTAVVTATRRCDERSEGSVRLYGYRRSPGRPAASRLAVDGDLSGRCVRVGSFRLGSGAILSARVLAVNAPNRQGEPSERLGDDHPAVSQHECRRVRSWSSATSAARRTTRRRTKSWCPCFVLPSTRSSAPNVPFERELRKAKRPALEEALFEEVERLQEQLRELRGHVY